MPIDIRSLIYEDIMKIIKIKTPICDDVLSQIEPGDQILISGTIYTARDAAHKRLVSSIAKNETLPFDPKNQILYYCGPSPAKEDYPIGSAGPTTSSRMDVYTEEILASGIKMIIGKGDRSVSVIDSFKKHQALYLIAIGGAGAFYANAIRKCELIAYPDLGAEAIYRLEVEDFLCFASDQLK